MNLSENDNQHLSRGYNSPITMIRFLLNEESDLSLMTTLHGECFSSDHFV